MRHACTIIALPILILTGCSSSDNGIGTMPMPDLFELPPDMAPPPRGPYPQGPYGVNIGDTLYDISSMGYQLSPKQTDSKQLNFTPIGVDQIHANPYCTCLLLTESASWCGPCQAEQTHIVDYVTKHPSFCVFGVLIQGLDTMKNYATQQDLIDWTQMFDENFPYVLSTSKTYYHLPKPSYLPTNVVVDPVTMKILDINTGVDPTSVTAEFDTAAATCAAAAK